MTAIGAATGGVAELDALRGPLTGYCYRMLGAAADTDDAVQETLLRAYRNMDTFDEARGRLSTWVHRIAHNVCVDMLRGARRRAVAVDLSGVSAPGEPIGTPLPAEYFVDPMPDEALLRATDPAERLVERETIRLAFVAALQHLTAQQRSVLILRDVLQFSAAETGDVLSCTAAAANSALQRARARLDELRLSADDPGDVADPGDPGQRDLLRRYVAAFEAHDVPGLVDVLREDATSSMPPFAWWVRGGRDIAELMGTSASCVGARLLPISVGGGINGAPGFGQYRPAPDGALLPFALVQVVPSGGRIASVVTFLETAGRFEEFGLPAGRIPPRVFGRRASS